MFLTKQSSRGNKICTGNRYWPDLCSLSYKRSCELLIHTAIHSMFDTNFLHPDSRLTKKETGMDSDSQKGALICSPP